MGFKIEGHGWCVPKNCVSTIELANEYGLDAASLNLRPGVKTRYFVSDESQLDLGVRAARLALQKSGLDIEDLDVVISASAVPYQPIPNTSHMLACALGIPDGQVEAVDVNMTCLSFLSALDVADMMLETGRARRVLIVSSETASRGLPWKTNPEVAAHFGDGAAAFILSKGETKVLARKFKAFTQSWNTCQLAAGGTRFDFDTERSEFEAHCKFDMSGKELFKLTFAHFPEFVSKLWTQANVSDVDKVVAHQASPLALRHLGKKFGWSEDKMPSFCEDYGNMIAASLPFVWSRMLEERKIDPGMKIALLGTSAGVSFGGMVLEMGDDTCVF